MVNIIVFYFRIIYHKYVHKRWNNIYVDVEGGYPTKIRIKSTLS